MKIDIKKIKSTIEKLEKNNNYLQEIEFNFNNQINLLNSIWNDAHSTSFFLEMDNEKEHINLLIETLNEYKKIFKYLTDNYLKYGNIIDVDLDSNKDIEKQFLTYKQKIQSTITKLEQIDSVNNSNEEVRKNLQKIKDDIEESSTKSTEVEQEYKKIYNDIQEIEERVKYLLNKIEIDYIEITELNNLEKTKTLTNKIGFRNKIELGNIIEKIDFFVNEEKNTINKIANIFDKINEYYNTDNKEKNIEVQTDILNELNAINKNRNDIIPFIAKKKEENEQLINKMVIELNNISKGQ